MVQNNDVKHAFPYARFLTLPFQRAGVNFTNAIPTRLKKKDVFILDFCKYLFKAKEISGPSTQGDVQGEARQEKEVEIAYLKEVQGVETTSQPTSTIPSSSHPPLSPQDA